MHYYVDGKAVPVSFARDDLGLDAYLVCPGPSLWDHDEAYYDALFKRGGIYVMGINTAWPRVRRPHAWVGLDQPMCYDQRLWFQGFPKFSHYKLATYTVGGVELRACPQTYWFDVGDHHVSPAALLLERDHAASFGYTRNTFIVALHILIWMGARRIHLVGTDMSVERGAYGSDERAMGRMAVEHNASAMAAMAYEVRQLAILAEERSGIEIVSCTEGSPLNSHLPWVPLEEAVDMSAARRVPMKRFERCRRIGARDLDGCKWSGRVTAGEGVVVAANAHEQWLLPEWLRRYRKHNDRPVCVVDMGMTTDARAWADEHADEVREIVTEPGRFETKRAAVLQPAKAMGRDWFYKPSAILWSPFERFVWSDLDVEVRGSLDPVFECIAKGEIAGQAESLIFRVRCTTGTMMNAGLMGIVRGDPLIEQWARYCYTRHDEFYGDQDALNYVMAEVRRRPVFFQPGVCGLRAEGPDPDALCFHWTGGEGKAHLWDEVRSRMSKRYALLWPERATAPPHNVRRGERDNPLMLPLQDRAEFLRWVEMIRRAFVWPRIVEVGTYDGCQRRFYEGLLDVRAMVTTDVEAGVADVVGDSASGDTVMAVQDRLPDHECEVLIIDGDHERAMDDHLLWRELVRPGGLIAWHDIMLPHVQRQWREAKSTGWESWEIVRGKTMGIGVLRKPGTSIPSRE